MTRDHTRELSGRKFLSSPANGGGGMMHPPHTHTHMSFSGMPAERLDRSRTVYGASSAQLLAKKKITGSGQVTEL